jgi:hypothetical protein
VLYKTCSLNLSVLYGFSPNQYRCTTAQLHIFLKWEPHRTHKMDLYIGNCVRLFQRMGLLVYFKIFSLVESVPFGHPAFALSPEAIFFS